MQNECDIEPEDSIADIRAIFNESGFLVLRRALDPGVVNNIMDGLKQEFTRLRHLRESGVNFSPEMLKHLDRSEMPAHPELATFRLDPQNYKHLTASPRLAEVLRILMAQDFLWHYPTMFREMSAANPKGYLPFHQDFSYNTHYPHLMTVWVPLVDGCGIDAPGIEIVEGRQRKRFVHCSSELWEFGINQEELAPVLLRAKVHRPGFHLGDVLIFDELTLHRTYSNEKMTKPRFSMDARAVPRSCISPEIWTKRKFISSTSPTLERRSHEQDLK